MSQVVSNLSRWGRAQYGTARWANTPENIGGTFQGQGVMTATGGLLGLILGSASFLGQGILMEFVPCSRDMVLTSIQMPRSIVAVTMPIAYITQLNVPSEKPSCGPVSTTVPATGSLDTLVEISSDPLDE